MGFLETLPPNCPPKAAHNGGCGSAFRFVSCAKPAAVDFASNQAKGETPHPEADPCRWASCSLYTDMATVQKKRKLKKLKRYPFVAELSIASGSGYLVQEGTHIDFWMSDTFDPLKAIVNVKAL